MTAEEMTVDEALGYPKAYADLCRNIDEDNHRPHRVSNSKANHLNKIFPVLSTAEDNTTAVAGEIDPNGFLNHLWKKLGHLGNAGFDPGLFRIDPYGNVLYFHSDRASPLFYHVDHWFPISRGGRTVPANLRVVQWQVSVVRRNRLDFLIPRCDLRLGISVNQFLAIFATRNADFKQRGFSFLFREGGSEELNGLKIVGTHRFPRDFSVRTAVGGEKKKEEEEMGVLKERNEKEVRELEGVLVKKRKRVEKSRRLAEAQASYKALLEKMILDAMHQNVVYKEHLRQNQAATGVLKARLEFQRELCDKSEKKLHGKNKERGELEKQIGVVGGGVSSSRKRTRRRVSDDIDVNVNENLPPSSRKKKELREFLEEEQWAAAMAEEKTELDMRCEANYEYTTPVREDQNEIGKGNLEKWVQILFENAKEGSSSPTSAAAHGGNDAKCVEWNKNEWKRGRREIGRVGGRFRSVSPSPSVGSRGRSGGGVYCRSVLQFRN